MKRFRVVSRWRVAHIHNSRLAGDDPGARPYLFRSPLGAALIGRTVGGAVTMTINGIEKRCCVIGAVQGDIMIYYK
ncbi:MAG: hypothetical protein Q7T01_00010 [bacterium]|nr:hypothetical protein [bacterium]